jgi:3-isopropylmalate/(R)-2-methylmalate dehydratase small subunit
MTMENAFRKRGTCHVFGDDIPLDEGVMAFKYAIERVTDPKLLIPHLFEPIDPGFAARVKPGDIVLAGKNFGCGKAHVQGFLAMAALKMGVLCESMPHKSLRRAVAAGLPILTGCVGGTKFVRNGDELEIDFESGEARNLSTGAETRVPPMPAILRDIVAHGGSAGSLRAWLAGHPELAAGARSAA